MARRLPAAGSLHGGTVAPMFQANSGMKGPRGHLPPATESRWPLSRYSASPTGQGMQYVATESRVRCTAPKRGAPGRQCGAFLCEVVPGTVVVEQTGETAPGCSVVPCPRCSTLYRFCATVGQRAA